MVQSVIVADVYFFFMVRPNMHKQNLHSVMRGKRAFQMHPRDRKSEKRKKEREGNRPKKEREREVDELKEQ